MYEKLYSSLVLLCFRLDGREKLATKKVSVAGIEPAALRKCLPQRSDLTPNRYQRH